MPTRVYERQRHEQATTKQIEVLRARRIRAKLQGQMCFERVLDLDQQIERLQAKLAEIVPHDEAS